jgi:hypothetical protein
MPGLKLNRVELPGSSGTFDFPSSEYGTKDIQIRMMYLSENYRDLRQKGHDLAYWLRPRESNSGSMPST